MTNRESDALAFITEIESYGGCVVLKTLGAMPDAAFPTRMVGPETKAALPQIRWAPVILQEYVAADTDVRAVVVGDQVYAAEITSAPSAYPHDYRVDLALARITPLTLPENVAGPLVSLAQRLGLDMGAADLRRTVDGGDAYCFLEINPSGEWLFLDEQTAGLVTSAVARLLTQPRSPEPGGRP
jgi:glutathione synthase/RimK-type ligase-like ATP-grasp enzyme